MVHDELGPDRQVRTELDRALTRLTTLGARLSRPGVDGGPSAADAVRAVLQPLADAVADAAGGRRRPVPVLADRAVADQLAVLGTDALGAQLPPAALTGLAERLTALRRSLP